MDAKTDEKRQVPGRARHHKCWMRSNSDGAEPAELRILARARPSPIPWGRTSLRRGVQELDSRL